MSGEHIRNEYGSSRCTRKEARLLAILTSRVTVWGIDYVAESPVKELSYVPVLDVSLIPSIPYLMGMSTLLSHSNSPTVCAFKLIRLLNEQQLTKCPIPALKKCLACFVEFLTQALSKKQGSINSKDSHGLKSLHKFHSIVMSAIPLLRLKAARRIPKF
ncbi:hypothetical protein L1987_88406 [Smallanthus sonchifolius]|nr:hypothetical protein L1987_89672 [Smallanthus sonchifolius]KAI3666333.1 hypothetical protein L1987_89162 [Smallanthus sonchifolius]KAI3666388.1 hypothetical protein L1987_89106 [Smallanthus sonchifolius]KAI3668490.1 hypothetical protein L1987_88512 [Smallanthus sonchifolius]KAI3668591.1 hypothetical protein L1987_88406 [Smallanthus sonchifolius]